MITLEKARSQVKSLSKSQRIDICPLRKLTATGNKKLPTTTAIFNMGSATDCPSLKLGLCSAVIAGARCYAKKVECGRTPQAKPYRDRQEKFWKSISAEDFATQFIFMNAMKTKSFNALRFNEAGDFWNQGCVDKAEKIATYLKPYGITTYVYTSRKDLDFTGIHNLIVIGSGFTKDNIQNEFKIVKDVADKPTGYTVCAMSCKKCNKCLVKGNKIVVRKH